jgi:hypothetical protein
MTGLLASLALIVTQTAPAAQPATRAALLEQERAAKAAALAPLPSTRVERIMFAIEDDFLIERYMNAPRGPFVRFGGFPTGAGLAAGPAWRFSNVRSAATIWGSASIKRYWELGGSLAFPQLALGKAFAEVSAARHEFPEEDFYGLGPDSQPADKTTYTLRETVVSGTAGVTPAWWIRASGTVEYRTPRIGGGQDPGVPSFHEVFPDLAPAGGQPDFVRAGARVAFDTTGRPFGPTTGGRYAVTYDRFVDRGPTDASFNRWEADLRQYIPVFGTTRTIALRGYIVNLVPDAGHVVPFYLQPTLGGPDSLRGLRAYRLRDRSLMLLQSEYRWDVNAFFGGVLFYEAGTVASRLEDLSLGDVIKDYGGGVRFGFRGTVSLRIEVAFGSPDGTRLVFRFSDVF